MAMNPCCALLKTSYLEKRKALRQGLQIQNEQIERKDKQIERLELENRKLKQACDEEQTRANVLEEEKGKETSLRISMENEISVLKSEISSEREAVSGNEELNKEVTLLQTCLSERQVEIDNLKRLLTEQVRRADAEKDNADTARKRVAELQQELAYEKNKADEARKKTDALENEIVALKTEASKVACDLGKKDEETKVQLEAFKNEVDQMRLKYEDAKKKLEAEKKKVINEKKRADEEKTRVIEQINIAEANEKRVVEEKSHATKLLIQLEEKEQSLNKLQKQLQEAMSFQSSFPSMLDEVKRNLEAETEKYAREKERADDETSKRKDQKKVAEACAKKAAEEKNRVDKVSQDLSSSRQRVEYLEKQLHEVNNMLQEAERKNALWQEKCAEAEKLKMDEQEKSHTTNLLIQLEEKEQNVNKLQKELQEAISSQSSFSSMLEAEMKKCAREKKRADDEKSKWEDQKKVAEASTKQAIEEKHRADRVTQDLRSSRQRVEYLEKQLHEVKNILEAERKRALLQEKCAAAEKLKSDEQEKSHTTNLLSRLEEKEQTLKKLQIELQEAISSQSSFSSMLEAEMKKYAREKKRADDETSKREDQKKVAEASTKKAIEEKHRADKVTQELRSSRQRVEHLEKQLHEVKNMLEAERKRVLWQEKCAEAEKLKSDEQKRIAAENERLATVEMLRANNLCQELENSRKMLQDMKIELHELRSRGKFGEGSDISPVVVNEQTSELQFLQKQLKFEKQRVKHAKEVAELEKDRNSMLQQELVRVRQGVECYLHQLTDIGARNGVNNVSKKSGLLSKAMLPSLLHPSGDAVFRMSSLSSRNASCQLRENRGFSPAGHHLESPSASFSDEQLVSSQGRVVGSLPTSTILAAEKSNLEETILNCSNERHRWMDGENVRTIAENSVRNLVNTTVHATKRRKILDELDYIKSMQSEGRRMFQEAEKKLSDLHSTIVQPVVEQTEKENCLMPVCVLNSGSNHDQCRKKRKASCEPEAICLQIDDSNVQAEVGKHGVALTGSKKLESSVVLQDQSNKKRKAPHGPEATDLHIRDTSNVQAESGRFEIVISASEGLENSIVLRDASNDIVRSSQDDTCFEELMNGDYMKLLNLDNAVDEECFRTAIESPLSPTLPEINIHHNQTRIDAHMLSVSISNNHEAGHQHGGFMQNKIQLYCIVFSDMEDDSTINRIFVAIRTCLTQSCMSLDTNWLVHDILAALGREKDLTHREKACALLSLILLHFSGVSSRKFDNYENEKLLDSFQAHINSVLCGVDKRVLFEEICHVNDLISLFEDFVMSRRIHMQSNSSSSFEITDEGKKYVISPNVASIDLVIAGSIGLASICHAIGHIGSICEVSFNIVRMCGTEDQMTLRILHIFSYLCGQEYVSDSCTSMKVVKSLIVLLENNVASNADMDLQSRTNGDSSFIPCTQCPFSDGLCSLDDISAMLLEELQNYCLGHLSDNQITTQERVFCNLTDVLSSLELIASKMGWKWACKKIVPNLLKMLESCDRRGRVLPTALVALLGELGRLGVKENEDGHDNGVEIIKSKLADCLREVDTSKRNAYAMAVVCALVRIHQKYDEEEFVNISEKLSSQYEIFSNCISSLSSEQITFLFGLKKPPLLT